MSWYSIFYWIAVADGVKDFFDVFSNIFTFLTIMTFIVFIFLIFINADPDVDENDRPSMKYWLGVVRKTFVWFTIFMVITWAGYVFCPSKKDALIIVGGGLVGKFMMSDSAARAIPSEVMVLLRDKIRAEIKDVNFSQESVDTLQSKTKEELIKMLRDK